VPEAGKSSSNPPRARRTTDAGASERAPRDEGSAAGNYRAATQDKLGQALSDLLENPLVTGAIGRAWGAREKAAQAQELWMGALNLPSAADIERLTRRLRSVSQRLEGVEDGVQLLGRSIVQSTGIESHLKAIDERLSTISEELRDVRETVAGLGSDEGAASATGSPAASQSHAKAGSRSRAAARPRPKH
jgi:hypothetical protein